MPQNRDRSRTSGKVVLMECHRRSEHFPVGAKKKVILFRTASREAAMTAGCPEMAKSPFRIRLAKLEWTGIHVSCEEVHE